MTSIRIFAFVGASVGAALVAGTFFQPDDAAQPGRTAAAAPVAPAAPVAGASAGSGWTLGSLLGLAGPGRGADPAPVQAARDLSAPDCAPALSVTAVPGAMLELAYHAPCAPAGAEVLVAHGPFRLTQPLGPEGRLALSLPAVAPEAAVSVALDGAPQAEGLVAVTDFDRHARLILHWTGPAGLDLHGYGPGAKPGEVTHLHAAAPGTPVTGFVTELGGQGPMQARVLTYPAGADPRAAAFVAEAEIALTAENCGQVLEATVTLLRADQPIRQGTLSVAIPGCDLGVGFILLPDLLPPEEPLDFAQLR